MKVRILAAAEAQARGIELFDVVDVKPDARAKELIRLGWAEKPTKKAKADG